MERNNGQASEAGGSPVPLEPLVAELIANRNRDEPVNEPLPIRIFERIVLTAQPSAVVVSCPKCAIQGLNIIFFGSVPLDKHLRSDHPTVKVTWECDRCKGNYPGIQSWSCHFAKCTGPRPQAPDAFICELCQQGFATQRGLSQHERHEHPQRRNARRAEAAERPRNVGGRAATVWSPAELEELQRREVEFANERFINKALMPFFPGKTNKQISDARRRLRQKAPNDPLPDEPAELNETAGADVPPVEPVAINEPPVGPLELNDPPVEPPEIDVPPVEPLELNEPPAATLELDPPPAELIELTEPPSETLPPIELVEGTGTAAEPQQPPIPDQPHLEQREEAGAGDARDDATADAEQHSEWGETLREAIRTYSDNNQTWRDFARRARVLVEGDPLAGDLDALYDELVNIIKSSPESRSDNHRGATQTTAKSKRRRGRGRRPPNRAERRAFAFARCQDLWNNCPKKLADIVVANDLSLLESKTAPPRADTMDLYGRLWGVSGPAVPPFERSEDSVPVRSVLTPITPTEIERKIKDIASSSAAGPDGLVKSDLRAKGISKALSAMFNLLLLARHYPAAWRSNRTTLIPKPGKDAADVKNWRPITISSMLSRLFSSLLDRRLRSALRQNARQKGFTDENGCFANTRLLNVAIRDAKAQGGVVSILDVSKAFDTVPHAAVSECLLRKGIPPTVAEYVAGMYRGCRTKIRTRDGEVEIELMRGVKQGDPLSPLIFNLIIEPTIERLQATQGLELEGENLAVLAFADDIVLLARNADVARTQLELVRRDLHDFDMALSIDKCSTFEYRPSGKSWYVRNPQIELGDQMVPYAEPDETLKYLGVKMNPWRGLMKGFERQTYEEVIARVKALPLKPMQKLDLLTKYLFPRYVYGLITSPPAKRILTDLDQLIRVEIKRILHIPQSTCDAFMYTPRKQGGLGLLQLETMVPVAAIRNVIKARASSDLAVRIAVERPECNRWVSDYVTALSLPWPLTLDQLDKAKADLRSAHQKRWTEMVWQGQGASDFAVDPLSNLWLTRQDLLKASRVSDAIRLRTNTYPTRAWMKRIDPNFDPRCRKCREADETLGHILGQCYDTKDKRIRRHDEIKNLLRDRLARTNAVLCEQVIEVRGERLKPDLVVHSNDKGVLVIDVTVRFENAEFLTLAAREKVEKYTPALGQFRERLGADTAQVVPIVVGSRGSLPRQTVLALKGLGIPRKDMLTISLIALRSSIEMIGSFMDS